MKMVWSLIFILHHHHHHRYMMCPWTIRSLRREMGGGGGDVIFIPRVSTPGLYHIPTKKEKKNPIIEFLFNFFP